MQFSVQLVSQRWRKESVTSCRRNVSRCILGCNLQWLKKTRCSLLLQLAVVSGLRGALKNAVLSGSSRCHISLNICSKSLKLWNHCKLQLKIATYNMTSATCNRLLFPALQDKLLDKWQDKLQDKLHCVTPAYSVQSLQAQKSCEISCKEGTLHAVIYLQRHCETSCKKNCIV